MRRPIAAGGFARGRITASVVVALASVGLVSAACAAAATHHSSSSKVVLTEADYYNVPPASTVMPALIKTCAKQVGVTVQRDLIPQASLVPKLLQEASTHSFPNITLIDNPNVQQFAATGALVPLKGISTKGIDPSIASAGSYKGKLYGMAPGVNDLGLYYNKALLSAAHLSPPKTWAELKADASKLTSGTTYGFGFSAANEEEGSWTFEPVFWGAGGSLKKLNSSAGVNALNFWQSLVTDGSVPKDVVNWTQADAEEQFAAGHLAMMINGPWQLPVLKTANGLSFGVSSYPVPAAGDKAISPMGGEMWTVGRSTALKQQKSIQFVQCMLSPKGSLRVSKAEGYISTVESVAKQQVKANPLLAPFAAEIPTARARTGAPAFLGTKYNTVSQALWTAIQAALSGQATPQSALNTAQQQASS